MYRASRIVPFFRSPPRGQATVELAIVLPLLMLITVAICQVAVGLNSFLIVSNASREGARRGARTNDVEEARDAAEKACQGLSGGKPTVDVSFPQGRSQGKPVQVTVNYRLPLLIPAVEELLPEITFSRTTSMALERGE